jgi:hypothetical protein
MERHLQEQISIYGEQTLVNLINQKGYERPVKDAYERSFAQVGCVIFNSKFPHVKWHRPVGLT